MSFWKDRSVLVTGVTGFLGLWLTRRLLDQQANVVGLVRDVVPQSPFYGAGLVERITTVRGTVDDYAVLERVLNEYEVDTVFHLAAQAIVTVANRNPLATFETNIKGTWTLLEACRRSTKVSRIVVASSDKAYGIHEELPYTEEHALRGTHPYDVSKSCADLIAITYHHTYNTPVSVTRCGNLFGPGDLNWSRIIPGTIRSALRGERPVIRSDGSPVRDYVHVEDIASAYTRLAEAMDEADVHGRGFNFATGEPLSVLDLTRMILKAADREDLEPEIQDVARAEIDRQYLSSELARKRLGWAPAKGMADRLAETVAWYRDHLQGRTAAVALRA
jgi:CDP-glucose 4,6-dehydratase